MQSVAFNSFGHNKNTLKFRLFRSCGGPRNVSKADLCGPFPSNMDDIRKATYLACLGMKNLSGLVRRMCFAARLAVPGDVG